MKLFTSFVTTLLYAAFLAIIFFIVQGIGTLVKATGYDSYIVGLILIGYFLVVWRDSYKKLGK